MKMSRLDAPKCAVGECPIWDVAEQALYFIDIFGKKIHRHDPASGATRRSNALPAEPVRRVVSCRARIETPARTLSWIRPDHPADDCPTSTVSAVCRFPPGFRF